MKKLIEKLASKEYCNLHSMLGGEGEFESCDTCSYKSVYIGDVLEKVLKNFVEDANKLNQITLYWSQFGLSKSLQQIEEESGYVEAPDCDGHETGGMPEYCKGEVCGYIQILISSQARKLSEFLNKILND